MNERVSGVDEKESEAVLRGVRRAAEKRAAGRAVGPRGGRVPLRDAHEPLVRRGKRKDLFPLRKNGAPIGCAETKRQGLLLRLRQGRSTGRTMAPAREERDRLRHDKNRGGWGQDRGDHHQAEPQIHAGRGVYQG